MQDLSKTLPVHPTKKPKIRKTSAIKQIVIHCTDWNCSLEELVKYDLGKNHISDTGCPTCTYHYVIKQSGEIIKAVDPTVVTWHAGIHNGSSIAVALIYKTDPQFESGKAKRTSSEFLPSQLMMDNLSDLLVSLCIELKIEPTQLFGHREMIDTGWFWSAGHKVLKKTCPGMGIDLPKLRTNIVTKLQIMMANQGYYNYPIDGEWGPKSKYAFTDLLIEI